MTTKCFLPIRGHQQEINLPDAKLEHTDRLGWLITAYFGWKPTHGHPINVSHPVPEINSRMRAPHTLAQLAGCFTYVASHFNQSFSIQKFVKALMDMEQDEPWGGDLDCAAAMLFDYFDAIATMVNPLHDVADADDPLRGESAFTVEERAYLRDQGDELQRLQHLARAAELKLRFFKIGYTLHLSSDAPVSDEAHFAYDVNAPVDEREENLTELTRLFLELELDTRPYWEF